MKSFILFCLLFFSNIAQAVDPENSTVRIVIMDNMEVKYVSSGVLVAIDETFGYILTAEHIMWGGKTNRYHVIFKDENVHDYIGLVAFANKKYDICLMLIKRPENVDVRPISWNEVSTGDKLWQSGWGGETGRVIPTICVKDDDKDQIAMSIKPRQGDSGGPIINNEGLVVGIISSSYNDNGYGGRLSKVKSWLSPMLKIDNVIDSLFKIEKDKPIRIKKDNK